VRAESYGNLGLVTSLFVASVAGAGFTAGWLTGTSVYAWRQRPRRAAAAGPVDPEPAHAFLGADPIGLQQDLARGAGPAVDDLAWALGLSSRNLPRFGALLRAHWPDLVERAQAAWSDPTAAQRFLRHVAELAAADPVLKADIAHNRPSGRYPLPP